MPQKDKKCLGAGLLCNNKKMKKLNRIKNPVSKNVTRDKIVVKMVAKKALENCNQKLPKREI